MIEYNVPLPSQVRGEGYISKLRELAESPIREESGEQLFPSIFFPTPEDEKKFSSKMSSYISHITKDVGKGVLRQRMVTETVNGETVQGVRVWKVSEPA